MVRVGGVGRLLPLLPCLNRARHLKQKDYHKRTSGEKLRIDSVIGLLEPRLRRSVCSASRRPGGRLQSRSLHQSLSRFQNGPERRACSMHQHADWETLAGSMRERHPSSKSVRSSPCGIDAFPCGPGGEHWRKQGRHPTGVGAHFRLVEGHASRCQVNMSNSDIKCPQACW